MFSEVPVFRIQFNGSNVREVAQFTKECLNKIDYIDNKEFKFFTSTKSDDLDKVEEIHFSFYDNTMIGIDLECGDYLYFDGEQRNFLIVPKESSIERFKRENSVDLDFLSEMFGDEDEK